MLKSNLRNLHSHNEDCFQGDDICETFPEETSIYMTANGMVTDGRCHSKRMDLEGKPKVMVPFVNN